MASSYLSCLPRAHHSLWPFIALLTTSNALITPGQSSVTIASSLALPSAKLPAVSGPDPLSALAVEASVRLELAQLSSSVVLPLPSNVADLPEYKAIAKIAAAPLPPFQATAGSPNRQEMVANLIAEAKSPMSTRSHLAERQSSLRVMVVGDSISQGQQGDYSWRYRIWQWFNSQNIPIQMVGPYTGTFQSTTALAQGNQPPTPPPPLYTGGDGGVAANQNNNLNGSYAPGVDQAFLSNDAHFSVWGRTVAADQSLIQQMVQNHPADLMLVELGFNDMGFFVSDYQGTLNSIHSLITNARAANPNLKFAVANVPQRTYIRDDLTSNITDYNNALPNAIQQWTTDESPVTLVDFEGNYACGTSSCPAGYDGLHPNAWGEFLIANAFSKSLIANFGIGKTPLSLPDQNDPSLVRNIDTPSNFQVFTSPQGASATWDPVFGAYSYDVNVSINGGGGGFSGPGSVQVPRWDSTWPLDGWSYAVSVRASCGDQHGDWTSVQTATAHPQLAPPPNNVMVSSTSDGFTVTWDPPSGPYTDNIVEYNIIYWDTVPSDCNFVTGAAFKSSPGTVTGLPAGKNYLVAPVTWNANGQGLPFLAHNVIPGAGTPPTPANLVADSTDATSIHLTWDAANGAAGYEVFVRNATGGSYSSLSNTTLTCLDDYFLFPGTNTYEFAIAAWNGNAESPQGPGVIPPKASTSGGPTCAPSPSWCPSYGQPYSGRSVGGQAGAGNSGGPPAATTSGPGTNPSSSSSNPSNPTSSTSSAPGSTSTVYPQVTNGHCTGPGCSNGVCTSIVCASFGCTGSDCNQSTGTCPPNSDCTVRGCIGPNCDNGICNGAGCVTKGCSGSDCDTGSGRCKGLSCISINCIGPLCGIDGICTGPNCSEVTCTGTDCENGSCVGPNCQEQETDPGGGSDAPDSDPDDECGDNGSGVTSAPSCDVTCFSATMSSTQSCTTNCQTTTGCSVTPTTATTTIGTDAYVLPTAIYDVYDFSGDSDPYIESLASADMASENSDDSQVVSSTSSSPTTSPTGPASVSAFPTNTGTAITTVQCFSSPANQPFPTESLTSAVSALCNGGYTLTPGYTGAFFAGYMGVIPQVEWAPNQSGCPTEQAIPIAGPYCSSAFINVFESGCASGQPSLYGGGYVAELSQGCVQFEVSYSAASPPPTSSPTPAYPTDQNQVSTVLCYTGSDYNSFNTATLTSLASLVCNGGFTLDPGTSTITQVYSGVTANVGWAANQSGCSSEVPFTVTGPICSAALIQAYESNCATGMPTQAGGGYVFAYDNEGCVFYNVAYPTSGG